MSEQTTMAPPAFGPPSTPPSGWHPPLASAVATDAAAPPAPRRRFRDRVFRLRSVLAVGLAGLILGGAAGAGIMALVQDGGSSAQSPQPGQLGNLGPGGDLRGRFGTQDDGQPGQYGGYGYGYGGGYGGDGGSDGGSDGGTDGSTDGGTGGSGSGTLS